MQRTDSIRRGLIILTILALGAGAWWVAGKPGMEPDMVENQPKAQDPAVISDSSPAKVVPEEKPAPAQPAESKQPGYSFWYRPGTGHQPPTLDPQMTALFGGRAIWLGSRSQPRIYLTFDCGYENGHTASILDTLKEKKVTATFFITGSYLNQNPQLVRRMIDEGHTVGNHTMNHPSLPELTEAKMREEITVLNQKIREQTGQTPQYLRPPNGAFNGASLEVVSGLGMKSVFWSLAYRDWEVDKQPGKEAALRQVLDNVHNGAVILLHAVSSSNREALPEMIDRLRASGYSFGRLNELK